MINIQKYVLRELDENKNSMAGTETSVEKEFPKEITRLKLRQELIVGHAKYDTVGWVTREKARQSVFNKVRVQPMSLLIKDFQFQHMTTEDFN